MLSPKTKMALQRTFRYSWNVISLIGFVMALTATGMIIAFSLFEVISGVEHAYLGLLTYFLFPGMLIVGLILVPVGAIRLRNKRRHSLELDMPAFPTLDLNLPRTRRLFILFILCSAVFVLVVSLAALKGYEFTESTTFCGELCHVVMEPEFVAWQNSPHAKVRCVECHVGPGAAWYVKAKISGLKQLYAVLTHTYPETIETPIEHLRPARETCEHCHWPEKFALARQKIFNHYAQDENNTPQSTNMLIHIGGSPKAATSDGIHWHIGQDVIFIARDRKRQDIPYVAVRDADGKLTEFIDTENPPTEEELANGKRRLMDCTDCHNRPSHIYHEPGEEMDLNFVSYRIDRKLPFIKKVAVELLNRTYTTQEEGLATIAKEIPVYYAQNYPKVAEEKAASINEAIVEVKAIYRRNFFPSMKIKWSTYPSNLGHLYSPGCFRCHDDKHKSAEGRYISKNCQMCHSILGQVQKNIPAGTLVNQFVHPEDIGEDLFFTNCSECHAPEE